MYLSGKYHFVQIPFFWIFVVNELMWFVYLVTTRPFKSKYLNRTYIINQFIMLIFLIILAFNGPGGADFRYLDILYVLPFPFGFVIVLINYVVDQIIEKRRKDRYMRSQMNREHEEGGTFIINESSTESDYYFSNQLRKIIPPKPEEPEEPQNPYPWLIKN